MEHGRNPKVLPVPLQDIRAPAPREGLIPVKRGATRHDCTLKGQLGFPSLSQQRRKRAPRNPEVIQVGGAGFKEPQTAGLPLASGPSPDVEQNRTIGQGWVHLWCGVWKFPSCPDSGIANPRSPKKRFPEDQVSQRIGGFEDSLPATGLCSEDHTLILRCTCGTQRIAGRVAGLWE